MLWRFGCRPGMLIYSSIYIRIHVIYTSIEYIYNFFCRLPTFRLALNTNPTCVPNATTSPDVSITTTSMSIRPFRIALFTTRLYSHSSPFAGNCFFISTFSVTVGYQNLPSNSETPVPPDDDDPDDDPDDAIPSNPCNAAGNISTRYATASFVQRPPASPPGLNRAH